MGKFLRIFFGCHARPDRSFYWHGRQFPICARCTGELAGILIGIPAILLLGRLSVPVMILFMLPMLIDGFVHLLTKYTSTNLRRVVTGFLFGIAFDSLLLYFHHTCVWIAGEIARLVFGDTEAVNRAIRMFLGGS